MSSIVICEGCAGKNKLIYDYARKEYAHIHEGRTLWREPSKDETLANLALEEYEAKKNFDYQKAAKIHSNMSNHDIYWKYVDNAFI